MQGVSATSPLSPPRRPDYTRPTTLLKRSNPLQVLVGVPWHLFRGAKARRKWTDWLCEASDDDFVALQSAEARPSLHAKLAGPNYCGVHWVFSVL